MIKLPRSPLATNVTVPSMLSVHLVKLIILQVIKKLRILKANRNSCNNYEYEQSIFLNCIHRQGGREQKATKRAQTFKSYNHEISVYPQTTFQCVCFFTSSCATKATDYERVCKLRILGLSFNYAFARLFPHQL